MPGGSVVSCLRGTVVPRHSRVAIPRWNCQMLIAWVGVQLFGFLRLSHFFLLFGFGLQSFRTLLVDLYLSCTSVLKVLCATFLFDM